MSFKRVGRDTASLFPTIKNFGTIVRAFVTRTNFNDIKNSSSQRVSHNLGVTPSGVIVLKQYPSDNFTGEWVAGKAYTSGQLFIYNGMYYNVISNHTSNANIQVDYNAVRIGVYKMSPVYITNWQDKSFSIVKIDGYGYNVIAMIMR